MATTVLTKIWKRDSPTIKVGIFKDKVYNPPMDMGHNIRGGGTLLGTCASKRRAEYTDRNVKTTPALFRATNPSKEILYMVVPTSLIFSIYSYLSWIVCFVFERVNKAFFSSVRAPDNEEIVNFYWSISRAPRQWPAGMGGQSPLLSPCNRPALCYLFCPKMHAPILCGEYAVLFHKIQILVAETGVFKLTPWVLSRYRQTEEGITIHLLVLHYSYHPWRRNMCLQKFEWLSSLIN